MSAYRKAIIAFVVFLITALAVPIQNAIADGHVDSTEWFALVGVAVGTVGVYLAKNEPRKT